MDLLKLLEIDPKSAPLIRRYLESTYMQFPFSVQDRIDIPGEDELHKYIDDDFRGIKCILGGTGSSKTYTTSYCVARMLQTITAPNPLTPFYIVSENFPMVGSIWQQKLSKMIRPSMISGITWNDTKSQFPKAVYLQPDEKGNSIVLQFYSYQQGAAAFEAVDALGFWLDEEAPREIIEGVLGRCRAGFLPNTMYYSLTPLRVDEYLEDIYNRRSDPQVSKLWKFYHLHALKNKYTPESWKDAYFGNLPEDIKQTRLRGQFAHFEGQCYPEFSNAHIIDPLAIPDEAERYLGIDFGWREAAVVWLRKWNNAWYITNELTLNQALVEEMASRIKSVGITRDTMVYADWADPAAMTKLKEEDICCIPADKAVESGIETVRRYMTGGNFFVFNTCKDSIKSIRHYRWKDAPKNPNVSDPKPQPLRKDNHHADGLRYAIQSAETAVVKPWEGVNIPKKPGRFLENDRNWDRR